MVPGYSVLQANMDYGLKQTGSYDIQFASLILMRVYREFTQCIRAFLVRYISYNREKGTSVAHIEEFEMTYTKVMSTTDLYEVVINRLAAIDLRTDYHHLIMLSLLIDLSKWAREHPLQTHSGPFECIVSQSICLLNLQQYSPVLALKQMELMAELLTQPSTMDNLEVFRTLYRRLKDVKEFYPTAIKEAQKASFLKCMEDCVDVAVQINSLAVLEFIFNSIFFELESFEDDGMLSKLRILRKLSTKLWIYHDAILHKTAYLIVKLSANVITNLPLLSSLVSLYEQLLDCLLSKNTMVPLLAFKHLVLNNIERILKGHGEYLALQILLSQLSSMFDPTYLGYFMRNYDWNFMQVPICQVSLNLLYEYTENRANEKNYAYELIKKHLKHINGHIRKYLATFQPTAESPLYNHKRKEYMELLQQINAKPKALLALVDQLPPGAIKDSLVTRIVHVMKKSNQVNGKSMIDIFGADRKSSELLFAEYVKTFIRPDMNLEEAIRLFTSNFLLSGESQQVERVIDRFTQIYYLHNKLMASSDATYTFANALLILNTDLHNPKNEAKISEEDFIKMCKGINAGQNIEPQIIKKTYDSIKKNKINHFRDRGAMYSISVSNWLQICNDDNSLTYYDPGLELEQECFKAFAFEVLNTVIDEKETAKIQALVTRFEYDDRTFECEIIEMVRKNLNKKPHLPLHVFQKILEVSNFKNQKTTDRLLSYYWLTAHFALEFITHLPVNLICEYLVFTWALRSKLQDTLFLREAAQLARIKKSIIISRKKEARSSIMNIFSNFLSSKDSEDEEVYNENKAIKPFKALGLNVFEAVQEHALSETIEFMLQYVHNEEAKVFQEFVSCLCLMFNLLYRQGGHAGQELFEELLGIRQTELTKRLANLQKKDTKKGHLLNIYSRFWVCKLALRSLNFEPCSEAVLSESLKFLPLCDKDLLLDLLSELEKVPLIPNYIYQAFSITIDKTFEEDKAKVEWFFSRDQGLQAEADTGDTQKKRKLEVPTTQKKGALKVQKTPSIENEVQRVQGLDQLKEEYISEVNIEATAASPSQQKEKGLSQVEIVQPQPQPQSQPQLQPQPQSQPSSQLERESEQLIQNIPLFML